MHLVNLDSLYQTELDRQVSLLSQIKQSAGMDIFVTKQLIQSICDAALNDYEYAWYFQHNQVTKKKYKNQSLYVTI